MTNKIIYILFFIATMSLDCKTKSESSHKDGIKDHSDCLLDDAYSFIQERIKAGRLPAETIIFLPADGVSIISMDDYVLVSSSFVSKSEWDQGKDIDE